LLEAAVLATGAAMLGSGLGLTAEAGADADAGAEAGAAVGATPLQAASAIAVPTTVTRSPQRPANHIGRATLSSQGDRLARRAGMAQEASRHQPMVLMRLSTLTAR
jgi:hypothetical protein